MDDTILGKRCKSREQSEIGQYVIDKWWLLEKIQTLFKIDEINTTDLWEEIIKYDTFLSVETQTFIPELISKKIHHNKNMIFYQGDNFFEHANSIAETKIISTSEDSLYLNNYYQLWEPDVIIWKMGYSQQNVNYSSLFCDKNKNIFKGDTIVILNRCSKIFKIIESNDFSYIY